MARAVKVTTPVPIAKLRGDRVDAPIATAPIEKAPIAAVARIFLLLAEPTNQLTDSLKLKLIDANIKPHNILSNKLIILDNNKIANNLFILLHINSLLNFYRQLNL